MQAGRDERRRAWTRREFLALCAAAAGGAAAGGCATNPVTGRRELMLLSDTQEIELDRQYAPHQFCADYGRCQDAALNAYVNEVGRALGAVSHRPQMPYSFTVLNSPLYNAYTFPGGTCGVLRGLLADMENEAQLAAVLGHEIGHVNARHAGRQYSRQLLVGGLLAGLTAYAASEQEKYAGLMAGLGAIGAGALLARYSRDDEREADALGMEYAARAGHNPAGMVEFMERLRRQEQRDANVIELMFATHPMSEERYRNAQTALAAKYGALADRPRQRERFLDHTAGLRRQKDALLALQRGASLAMRGRHAEAAAQYQQALRQQPDDYAGLLLMANGCLAQRQPAEARRYARAAREVYPAEPQAALTCVLIDLQLRDYAAAREQIAAYRRLLPGNPDAGFYEGRAWDGMGRREEAAQEYLAYLRQVREGEKAQFAYRRLVEWGVIQPAPAR